MTLRGDRLCFPAATPTRPGVYRLRILDGADDDAYVGETINLRRRFNSYRNPGPSQATNQRVNAKLTRYLTAGCRVIVDISEHETVAPSDIGRSPQPLNLREKWNRVLLERAAEVSSRTKYKLINL